MSGFFKECKIAVLPDVEIWENLKRHVLRKVQDAGGALLSWSDKDCSSYTHVVADHHQELHAQLAVREGLQIVSLLWLWECIVSQRLLPVKEEQLYNSSITASFPAASELVLSITGYQGMYKMIFGRMLSTFGLTYTKNMNPLNTSIVIAGDTTDVSSAKVKTALELGIPVVNVLWLYDCLRQGTILPADGYKRNPPIQMDPFRGALALDASLQVIANSGSSEEDSKGKAPESASRVGRPKTGGNVDADPPMQITQSGRDLLLSKFVEAIHKDGNTGTGIDGDSQPKSNHIPSNPGQETVCRSGSPPGLNPSSRGAATSEQQKARKRPSGRFSPPRLLARTPAGLTGSGSRSSDPPSASAGPGKGDQAIGKDGAAQAQVDMPPAIAQADDPPTAVRAQQSMSMDESYANMSQEVRVAEGLVGVLVGLPPAADKEIKKKDYRTTSGTAESPGEQAADSPREQPAGSKEQRKNDGFTNVRSTRIPININANTAPPEADMEDEAAGTQGEPGPADSGVIWRAKPVVRSKSRSAGQPEDAIATEKTEKTDKKRGKRGPAEADLAPLVGHTIKKKFEQGVFKGTVKSYDRESKYYRVVYEDEDSEDLSETELERLVEAASQEALKPAKPLLQAGEDLQAGADIDNNCQSNPVAGEQTNKGGAEGTEARRAASNQPGRKASRKPRKPQKAKRSPKKPPTKSPQSTRKTAKKRPVFTVSGMHSDARKRVAQMLKALGLGAPVNLCSHQWNSRCTHLLLPDSWTRGAKVLAAMASGAWLLSENYLAASKEAHLLVEEDYYEIVENKKKSISKGSPKHWRMRKQITSGGSFQGLKVAILGEMEENSHPKKEEIDSILQSGSANVITVSQALIIGAHFIVTKPSRSASDSKLRPVMEAGLCIVSPAFVVEWVAHPWKLLSKHVLFSSRVGSDLTKAAKVRGTLQGSLAAPVPSPRQKASAKVCDEESEEESQLY